MAQHTEPPQPDQLTADTLIGDVAGVGRPAARALAEQGLTTVGALADQDWAELAQLHGVGPAAGRRLQAALVELGLGMANAPAPASGATVTRGHTGTNAPDLKTHATSVTPTEFLATLEDRRRGEGHTLLELFAEVAGEPGTMWGPSMVGFGQVHYRYATGREGDTFQVGFSPRTSDLALYGLNSTPESAELLARLGKHREGKSCVWVRKLADVDQVVLRELVARAWAADPSSC